MPPDLEVISGALQISANIREIGGQSQWQPVSASMPIQARQLVELIIMPSILAVVIDPSTSDGRASLILRGTLVAKHADLVKGVSCGDCKVEWKLNGSPGSQTAVLTVSIRKLADARPMHSEILLEIQEKGELRIPIFVPPSGGGSG
jgi:hypothetical protein